jgi:hypothetical protein
MKIKQKKIPFSFLSALFLSRCSNSLVLFGLILSSQAIKAQSRFSLTPGVFYNGGILREYTG